MSRVRVDALLVERNLAPSRERAQAYILAGQVYSGERRIEKAGQLLARDAPLDVRRPDHGYVSRGGLKLQGALEDFGLDPAGLVAADIGASTGGFTDCLLSRGAARVYAIDVGYGQLHERLRKDPRVVVLERTNARHLDASSLPEAVDWVVVDASFIGLAKLLPAIKAILRPEGVALALVKPQFEVGRGQVGKHGVVRDPVVRKAAIDEVISAARSIGFIVHGEVDCRVPGPRGNVEAFVHLESPMER